MSGQVQQKPILHGRDHLKHGPDPIPGLPDPRGDDIEDIIKGLPGLDAFWKLNEASGTVAADSSGNMHDLQPDSGFGAPTWGQTAGPPGDPTALFVDNGDALNDNADVAMGAFTDDFSAGIWANVSSVAVPIQELIGQGQGAVHGGAATGWGLGMVNAKVASFADTFPIYSNNDLLADTWYFFGTVRDAGTWKLYVNGLLQASTQTQTIGAGDASTWIGNDGFGGHSTYLHSGLLSYGFIADSVLTSDDFLEIYEAGTSGPGAGRVWTSDGAGGASWQYPTIQVEY